MLWLLSEMVPPIPIDMDPSEERSDSGIPWRRFRKRSPFFQQYGFDIAHADTLAGVRIGLQSYFTFIHKHHSLSDWLHEWRRTESQQMALSISERTPDAWIDVLTRLTQPLRTIGIAENPGVFIHESSLIDQKATPLIPFEYEWKPLFELYYRLHVLDAGWTYVKGHLGGEPTSFFYGKWYVQNWLTEQLGKLNDSVNAIGAKPKLFEADAFHERVKDLVRTFALGNSGLFDERFQVYRLFWQHLFPFTSCRRNAELTILTNEDHRRKHAFSSPFST